MDEHRTTEWNDANNALVGYGLSMVAGHLLRYVRFVAIGGVSSTTTRPSSSAPIADFDSLLAIFLIKTNPHASTTDDVLRAHS